MAGVLPDTSLLGGAFWDDRYHATAVEAGTHLARCLVDVDLKMVRAGSVAHPAQWKDRSS